MQARREQPVGLMELPVELRLLIYECIPIERKDFVCPLRGDDPTGTGVSWSTITMSWQHTTLQILRVSRLIHKEAKAIMAKKVHKISVAVPRISVDKDMIHQLFRPCGLLRFVTYWYQTLKETDGRAHFVEWITRQAACSPLAMFGMPKPMLMFIQQAGHQMFGRMQLLESLRYSDGVATASVFFLIQVTNNNMRPRGIPYDQHRSLSWWRGLDLDLSAVRYCMPVQLHNFQIGTVAEIGHCVECIFIWRVAVKTVERSHVRTVSVRHAELWDYLELEEWWPIVQDRKGINIDDPFDEGP